MLLTNLPDDIIYTIYDNASLIEKVKMMYISKRIYILIEEMVYEDIKIFIRKLNSLIKIHNTIYKYIHDNKIIIDVNYIVKIIINGNKNIIYNLINIYDMDNNTNIYKKKYAKYFAYFGNKKILIKFQAKYDIKHDPYICVYIASSGNLGLLKWAHSNGYIWDRKTCIYAAENGQLDCLKYAHENNCPWDTWTCAYAAEKGQLECLKYAHENGCLWDEWTCKSAVENGQLECLIYAHENGCQWDRWICICTHTAENGQLECLKYAHENGCRWNIWTCALAAKNGQLECLKYAHENGCQWDEATCIYAAKGGQLECLKYSHENDCPYDKNKLLINKKCLKNYIIEYIEKYM